MKTEKPRQWKPFPLLDPRSHARKGGISLPADVQADIDKTARLTGKTPAYSRSGQ